MQLDKNIYNKKELAKILNIHPMTIETLENKGVINKGQKEGKLVLYTREDVIKALKYYEITDYNNIAYDLIFTDNVQKVNQINDDYNLDKFFIAETIEDLKGKFYTIRRAFIDKNFVKEEDYDLILTHLSLYDIEIIDIV